MSPVVAIFNDLSDEALKAIVRDLQQQDATGVLPDGPARALSERLVTEVGVSRADAFNLVQHEPLRRAAFKWAAA